MPCRHHDVQIFDDIRCCLACGETVFESTPDLTISPQHEGSVFYEYAPLNYALGQEIRLAVVFPGRPSDDVTLDIVHVNLTDEPAYEAVSYAWATQSGDASLSQAVYCRGRTITVTKHCEAALKSLRRRGCKRRLWIDAISIDQGNISERNHQVGFMGTIYSNASQVLIYLGPGTEGTDSMLDYLNGDAAALSRFKRGGLNQVVKEFLRIRWLDRVWVLQEIALAKLATMTAGDKTVRWTHESIKTLLGICKNLNIEPPSALHWLPASEPHTDILTVLQKSRNCSSTDPRDKVFAILGLAHQRYQEALPVDYSLTSEEVFARLAVHLIEENRSLDVLKHTTGQADILDLYTLPSWVPRWDVKVGYDPLPSQFTFGELDTLMSIWFSSKPLSNPENAKQPGKKVLDEILKMIPFDEPVMSTYTWQQWLSVWANTTRSKHTISSTELEALAISLTRLRARDFHFSVNIRDTRFNCQSLATSDSVGGAYSFNPQWSCLRVRAHNLDIIRKPIGIRSANQAHLLTKTLPRALGHQRRCSPCKIHFVHKPICQQDPSVAYTMLDEFSRELNRLGHGKTLFQTEQSIGFAQAKVMASDGIWALDGADVPFVLRRVDSYYVLIGECYLYRALRHHPCICCGCEVESWPITTEIIDIW